MWPFKKKQKPKKVRSYQGALYDRLVADWVAAGTSADAEIKTSLAALRNRSRQLARDDDYVKNILRLIQVNVVGEGMPFQAQIRNERGGLLNTVLNDLIEKEWNKWAKADSCDVTGKLHFSDIQKIATRATAQDGDIFIRKIKQSFGRSKVPLALELIEADLCDETYNDTLTNGNVIKMGIEFNEWGRPVAYHFYTNHPGDTGAFYSDRKRIRIPADEVIHLMLPERVKQSRGVPLLASTIMKLHQMKGLTEAEVIAARATASLMGFIETPEGELQGDDVVDGQRVTEFEPGVFKQLNPGEKVNVPSINRPGNQFEPFMKVMLRSVAAGAGVSYESISRDYSNVNYSSARQALLEDRDSWRVLQKWLINNFNQVVFEAWLEQAVLAGVLPLPKFFQNPDFYFESIRWMPRGWSWVDPTKEVAAYKEALRCGFTTQSEIIAQGGGDFEETLISRAREIELADKYGLKFDSNPSDDPEQSMQQNQPSDNQQTSVDDESGGSRKYIELAH